MTAAFGNSRGGYEVWDVSSASIAPEGVCDMTAAFQNSWEVWSDIMSASINS